MIPLTSLLARIKELANEEDGRLFHDNQYC